MTMGRGTVEQAVRTALPTQPGRNQGWLLHSPAAWPKNHASKRPSSAPVRGSHGARRRTRRLLIGGAVSPASSSGSWSSRPSSGSSEAGDTGRGGGADDARGRGLHAAGRARRSAGRHSLDAGRDAPSGTPIRPRAARTTGSAPRSSDGIWGATTSPLRSLASSTTSSTAASTSSTATMSPDATVEELRAFYDDHKTGTVWLPTRSSATRSRSAPGSSRRARTATATSPSAATFDEDGVLDVLQRLPVPGARALRPGTLLQPGH